MDENLFVVRGGAKIGLVSKEEICRCTDGGGRLFYDFRRRKFVLEGRCKLFLLCTIIEIEKFKSKMLKNNFGELVGSDL